MRRRRAAPSARRGVPARRRGRVRVRRPACSSRRGTTRGTSRCRSSATTRQASSTSSSATARCSAATRRSSRSRRRAQPRPALRDQDLRDAVHIARSIGYGNAGTVEFLLDEDTVRLHRDEPRIQVEHTVTEEVTGRWTSLRAQLAEGNGCRSRHPGRRTSAARLRDPVPDHDGGSGQQVPPRCRHDHAYRLAGAVSASGSMAARLRRRRSSRPTTTRCS